MDSRSVVICATIDSFPAYTEFSLPHERIDLYPAQICLPLVVESNHDLAIIDCGRDTDNGIELLKGIKSNRADLPVIFVAEASSEEVVLQAFRAGAYDYFSRPFDVRELSEAVMRVMKIAGDGGIPRFPRTAENRGAFPELLVPIGQVPDRIKRAIGFMKQNLAGNINLEDVSREACLSKFHFCRLFRKHVGITPIQFLLSLRIHHATVLLSKTSLPISVVAFRTGFSDLSEFSKKFKKVTGTTPSRYRSSIPATK